MPHDEPALSRDALLAHWLGHRRLTRRTIETFPDDALYGFTPVDGMRSFGSMMNEVVGMIRPTLEGVVGGRWEAKLTHDHLADKTSLLTAFDDAESFLHETWPNVTSERLAAVERTFFPDPAPLVGLVLYLIDNEVHHRAQGFVYLRHLGIEPPAFYVR